MELQFQKVGGRYEAEFEATGDFNLHCERKGAGNFKLYQKGTPEGQYATESSYADHNAEAVVDKDFSMLVYPKHIKVVSEKEVTYCVATISGGGSIDDNPTDGVSLRPVTADDVILYKTNQFGEEEIPFSNTIVVPGNNGLGIKIKDNKKSLFFTGRTAVIITAFEGGELYGTIGFGEETTINLEDVYIKD